VGRTFKMELNPRPFKVFIFNANEEKLMHMIHSNDFQFKFSLILNRISK
jgi:hypothetical protein